MQRWSYKYGISILAMALIPFQFNLSKKKPLICIYSFLIESASSGASVSFKEFYPLGIGTWGEKSTTMFPNAGMLS